MANRDLELGDPAALLRQRQQRRQQQRRQQLRLLHAGELPAWYQHNPHILTGYRDPNLDTCACAATLCAVHNETGNIWTHLLGAAVWVVVCGRALASDDLAMRADEITFRLHTVCYALCGLMPLASAGAHLFHIRGPLWYQRCWAVDHFGIVVLWFARAVLEGFVCWWCHRGEWSIWVITSCVVFAATGYWIVRHAQTALFLPLYAYLHIPMLGVATSAEFWAPLAAPLRASVGWALAGSLCGVLGYVVMKQQLPEKWAPGKFDVVGHSHQWWHILTVLGPVLCLEADRGIYHFRLESTLC